MNYTIDGASKLVLRTRAQGLLARLAHDLSIASSAVTGTASVEGEGWTARLTIATKSLRVEGVVRGDRVETGVLGDSDRAEIERKLATEVIGAPEVAVEARGLSRRQGKATLTLGRSSEVPLTIEVTELEGGALVAKVRGAISLSALGIAEIKGPLGAFKVADEVKLLLDATLRPA